MHLVLLVMSREPPDEINLGIFGTFKTRRYIPHPRTILLLQLPALRIPSQSMQSSCTLHNLFSHSTEGCLLNKKMVSKLNQTAQIAEANTKHGTSDVKQDTLLPKTDSPNILQPPQPCTFTRKIHDWSKPREPQHLTASALSHETVTVSLNVKLHTFCHLLPIATSLPVSQHLTSPTVLPSVASPDQVGTFCAAGCWYKYLCGCITRRLSTSS